MQDILDKREYFIERIKEHPSYSEDDSNISFEYELSDELISLVKEFELDKIAGNGDELSQITNLLDWVYKAMTHDGYSVVPEVINTRGILEHSKKEGVNCYMKATVLAEVYLAMGFKARYIRCLPYWYEDPDCHVVTHIYSNTLGKWIMMDPTLNGYFINDKGIIMSLEEVRDAVLKDIPYDVVIQHDNDNLNDKHEYKVYMSKNVFRFQSPKVTGYGTENDEDIQYINLDPIGYSGFDNDLRNLEWRKEKFKEEIDKNPRLKLLVSKAESKIKSSYSYISNSKLFWAAT